METDQLSAIKWSIMEKAKFGLHSLNAERKKAFQQQHGLVLRVATAGRQMVPCHVKEAGVK